MQLHEGASSALAVWVNDLPTYIRAHRGKWGGHVASAWALLYPCTATQIYRCPLDMSKNCLRAHADESRFAQMNVDAEGPWQMPYDLLKCSSQILMDASTLMLWWACACDLSLLVFRNYCRSTWTLLLFCMCKNMALKFCYIWKSFITYRTSEYFNGCTFLFFTDLSFCKFFKRFAKIGSWG